MGLNSGIMYATQPLLLARPPMSFANLSRIGLDKPLRLLLIHAGDAESITWAGLVQPLRLCARALGPDALQLEVRTP